MQDNSIEARLARLEESNRWILKESQEICTALNGPEGLIQQMLKRISRLEYYLAIAIGGGIVIAWVLDKSVGRLMAAIK